MCPILAEELFRALFDRQEAHHPFLDVDDAAFPPGKIDAERLSKSADDIKHKREALGLDVRRVVVFLLMQRFFIFDFVTEVIDVLAAR